MENHWPDFIYKIPPENKEQHHITDSEKADIPNLDIIIAGEKQKDQAGQHGCDASEEGERDTPHIFP